MGTGASKNKCGSGKDGVLKRKEMVQEAAEMSYMKQ